MRLALVLLCGLLLWDSATPASAFGDAELQLILSGDELAVSSQNEHPSPGKRTKEPLADPASGEGDEASVYAVRPSKLNQLQFTPAVPRASFDGAFRRSILALPQTPRAPPQPSILA